MIEYCFRLKAYKKNAVTHAVKPTMDPIWNSGTTKSGIHVILTSFEYDEYWLSELL